jgi:flagellar protein FliO/FliZ
MFEAIFGTEMPLAFRFFIAFVIVLGLIGGAAYLVRRFGTGALNAAGMTRGRPPRLAVTEFAAVDARRRLVLIRRDNVEHLVMIGGPSDVVIEPNIVRASPASSARDAQPLRPAASISDVMPRATSLDDGPAWPPQIEPAPRPQRVGVPPPAAAIAAEDDDPDWSEIPEPAPRAIPDSMLRAIPDAPLRVVPEPALRAVPDGALRAGENTPRPVLDGAPRANNAERFSGLAPDLSRNFVDPDDAPAPPRRGAEARRPPAPVQPLSESEEQNLAEMAQRLETALQRPRPGPEPALASASPAPVARGGETARAEPEPAQRAEPGPAPRADIKSAPRPEPAPAPRAETKSAPRPEPNPAPRAETKSAPRPEPGPAPRAETKATPRLEPAAAPRAEAKPTPRPDVKPAAKTAFDNLEQEMASLLGRPSGKT